MEELTFKQARIKCNITLKQMASILKCHLSSIYRIENNEYMPNSQFKKNCELYFKQYDIKVIWLNSLTKNEFITEFSKLENRIEKIEKLLKDIQNLFNIERNDS